MAKDALTLANTLDERSHREIRSFLSDVQGSAERVRANLTEVMLAQGFQDLTGQILHGIRTLIVEVESVLDELAKISGRGAQARCHGRGAGRLHGPAIPGSARIPSSTRTTSMTSSRGLAYDARTQDRTPVAGRARHHSSPAAELRNGSAAAPAPLQRRRACVWRPAARCGIPSTCSSSCWQWISATADVLVDGSAVERIDTAGLQMLVAFARHQAGRGKSLRWTAVSPELMRGSRLLGLDALLGLAGMQAAGATSRGN